MNILNIITGTDNGGGGEYVVNICKSHIFTSKLLCIGYGDLYEKAKSQNIDVSVFEFSQIIKEGLNKYIKSNKIDIILWHGAKAFFLHKLIKKNIDAKSIAVVHSDFYTDFLNNKIKKIIFTKLSYSGLKSFEEYVAVSSSISDLLKRNFKYKNIFIARNGIDKNKYTKKHNNSVTRAILNIKESDFVLINIARFHPVKNHIKLLEGFKRLVDINENCKLILVGDGSERKNIEDFLKNNNLEKSVVMVGEKKNVIEYLDISDANILASVNEGGEPPIVILEGAIMGKPTLCSNINNLRSIINDERGYVFNPHDSDSIYKSMKKCIDDKEKEKKASSLKKYVDKNFSIEYFYNNYREIFQIVMQEGN
ncbi:glycosyltransferase family 4 protein [uncultured Clostridium sp.]|uniref:glycosyltransferase family 4 protein n=1 Tax=uncultured Clostridium sp. TaxID=59620 RepID=UPI0025F5612D|nr:glycosyltransferase family 4 protein [uncultured Clostridium sp.]